MLIIVGPAGSGKSLQGQILQARFQMVWLSMGKLIRQSDNATVKQLASQGKLIPPQLACQILYNRLDTYRDLSKVIVDGFPRSLDQAQSLVNYLNSRADGNRIDAIIALDIGRYEVIERLVKRQRNDDNEDAINRRLDTFTANSQPILDYFMDQGVNIQHILANRTVGQVHDQIVEQVVAPLNML